MVKARWRSRIANTDWRSLVIPTALLPLLFLGGCEAVGDPADPGPAVSAATAPEVGDAVISAMVGQARIAMVRKAQKRLARLGYRPGRSDGVAGSKTRHAILQYQADMDLPRDGVVSQGLLDHLARSIDHRPEHPETWLLSRLPMADYEPGDTFVYSNGRVDTVVAVRKNRVSWRSNQGTSFEASRNFVLPWFSWRTPAEQGRRLVQASADLLWPLVLDEEKHFTATRVVQVGGRPDNLHRTRENWRCGAEGRARVALVTGTFETVRIACERRATDTAPRHKRVWYYAPRLRHYVRIVDLDENAEVGRRVDLIAMQMTGPGWPEIVRTGLRRTLEHAATNLPEGESALWESSAIGAVVEIQPVGPPHRFDNTQCRTLLQTLSKAGDRRDYPGLACRDPDGRWQVVGFQNNEPLLKEIARNQVLRGQAQ